MSNGISNKVIDATCSNCDNETYLLDIYFQDKNFFVFECLENMKMEHKKKIKGKDMDKNSEMSTIKQSRVLRTTLGAIVA